MARPGPLSIVYDHQYLLTTMAGTSTSSVWLDSGYQFTTTGPEVLNRTKGIGLRIASFSLDGGTPQREPLTTGNITISFMMNAPHTLTINIITQYQLSTPTGSVVSITEPTIGGDSGWYDSGTPIVISYDYVWNVVPQQSRLAATGYSVDGGAVTNVTEGANGTFKVAIAMNSAHTIDVKYATQYYISFQFSDAAGKRTITPATLQIAIGTKTQQVPGFTIWLDRGTSFSIASVTYEGLDVKPLGAQQYSVTGPAAITLNGQVYDATLKVTDFLNLPVQGANVKMTLANGTVLSGSTGNNGTFTAPAIPLGTFTARVSGIGSSIQVMGDASKQSVTSSSVLFSTTSFVLVVAIVIAVVGLAVFMLRRMSGKRTRKTTNGGGLVNSTGSAL